MSAQPDPTSVGSLLDRATSRLRYRGSSSPRLDAMLLLSRATDLARSTLLAHPERLISEGERALFEALMLRRLAYEPIAYLLGRREFYGREFFADSRALIPRPETELLVEIGLSAIREWRIHGVNPAVVDVGTGAGPIAITLALESNATVVAVDRSWGALSVARANCRALGADTRVRLVCGDLLTSLAGPLHVILANLPYVPENRLLPPDVVRYEPTEALFGGPSGMEVNQRFLATCPPLLASGGTLAIEIDDGQGTRLSALAQSLMPGAAVCLLPDGFGRERVLQIVSYGATR